MTGMPSPPFDVHLLREVLNASVMPTVIVDAQGDHPIRYVNAAFERLTGFSAAEVLGRNSRFLQGVDQDQPAAHAIRSALQEGSSVTVTLRNYQKNGTLFLNELTVQPVRDARGTITHFVGYPTDVTALDARHRRSPRTRQLTSVLSRVTEGIVALDRDLNFTYLNEAAAGIAGRTVRSLTGRHLMTTFPTLASTELGQALRDATATGRSQQAVSRLLTLDRWIEATVHPAEDGVLAFIRDVTDEWRLRQQLHRSEARFARVFQASPLPMLITRFRDQHIIDVNDAFVHASGYDRPDLLGRTSLELGLWRDPADRSEVATLLEEGVLVQEREMTLCTRWATERIMSMTLVILELDGELCAVSQLRDVTVETSALRALEDSERRHRQLATELQRTLDLSTDLIVTLVDGTFESASAASFTVLGYQPHELIGRPYLDFVHPDDRALSGPDPQRSTHGHPAIQSRHLHRDGRVVWMEWSAIRIPEDQRTYAIGRDVTGHRAAQEDQAYLAAIVQASQDAIIGVALDGTIRSWNAAAEQLYGYAASQATGESIRLILPTDGEAPEWAVLDRVGRGEQIPPFESVAVTRAGRHVPLLVTISPILNAERTVIGMSTVAQDISARRAAQAQIERLNTDLRRQLTHVAGLRAIDHAIATSQGLDMIFEMVLDHLTVHLGCGAAAIFLTGRASPNVQCAASRGWAASARAEELVHDVLRHRVMLTAPAGSAPEWTGRTECGAPLLVNGRLLGVLVVTVRPTEVLATTWTELLEILAAQTAVAVESAWLLEDLAHANEELRSAYDENIEGWARALDLRDKETEGHSRRVTDLTVRLCERLNLPPERLVDVRRGALLHDIGKMGVPDAVLFKPGALNDEEWRIMKQHPQHAMNLLRPIAFLRAALSIPEFHHEKWDGTGYLAGLKGEEIPLEARAFAVVDVYDALTNDRPYRRAWTPEAALAYIQGEAGTHFDPIVVRAFAELLAASAAP